MNNGCNLDGLGAFSDVLQIINFLLNVSQSTTDDLMGELQHQNSEYLETIIQQNKEIIERLERIENVRLTKSDRNL